MLCSVAEPCSLALDLRTMQDEFLKALDGIIAEELSSAFAPAMSEVQLSVLLAPAMAAAHTSFAQTSNMDADTRLGELLGAVARTIVEVLTLSAPADGAVPLGALGALRAAAGRRGAALLRDVRRAYLCGERGPAPASRYLRGTRPVYDFVRTTLGIRMHGKENLDDFSHGLGVEDVTVGENVSVIYEVRLARKTGRCASADRPIGDPRWTHAGRDCGDVCVNRIRRSVLITTCIIDFMLSQKTRSVVIAYPGLT
jgi:hypothetical protein